MSKAQHAAIYFKALFGIGFSRTSEGGINAALNYGYAIIRGAVARTLALYGFEYRMSACITTVS
jgi:CRISPR-associated protein Cas1